LTNYDVIIIGGGVSGINCGVTLASNQDKFEWSKDKKYLIIDDGKSDLNKASLFNVAGFSYGVSGVVAMSEMKEYLANFNQLELKTETVVDVSGVRDNFKVVTSKQEYKANMIVFATGMHQFEITGLDLSVVEHDKVMKPNKIKIQNIDNKISDGVYVCGLASGVKTMYLIAAGDGCKVGCDIFQEWTGKHMVAHDSVKDAIS